MANPNDSVKPHSDEIDLRTLVRILRKKWYYFPISLAVFLSASWAYLKLTTPIYEATASVLIKDSKNKSDNIESILSGDLFGNSKNVSTEIGILTSRAVLKEVVDELGLSVSYFEAYTLFDRPVYRSAPFIVQPLRVSSKLQDEQWDVRVLDANSIELSADFDDTDGNEFEFRKTVSYGDTLHETAFDLVIRRADSSDSRQTHDRFHIVLNSDLNLFRYYAEHLTAEPLNKDATIVNLTLRDPVRDRAIDFLNALGRAYVNQDVKDKSSVAALTLRFVDEQLEQISRTLGTAETALQRFKEEKGTVDLSEEAKAYLARITAIDAERAKAELELKSLDQLFAYVNGNRESEDLAPATLGSPDPVLIDLVTQLKQLQSRRSALLSGSSKNSPAVRIINEQINSVRNSLIENIRSLRNQATVQLGSINEQLGSYESDIRKIPGIERELLGIRRNFTVNENIYLYLLQKKAETGIAKATAVSDNKVLDTAIADDRPIAPEPALIIVIGLLLGIFCPFTLLTINAYTRSTIDSREDVEQLTRVPIIGVIGHHTGKERMVVANKPKSAISEAFRSIRANLMFMGLSEHHKTILITSSVGGEGKSFTTLNLSAVLALQHHKVVILGMDLRKPQLFHELAVSNDNGMSKLLTGQAKMEEVIRKTSIDGLDIIPSGPVPPNPSELLAKREVGELISELGRRYDFIIIDTPPVGIVSDAVALMKHADVNLFLVRENYSKKEYLRTINELYEGGKAKNLCMLINDAGGSVRYGYGYTGYGYYDDEHLSKGRFGGWLKRR